MSLLLRRLLFRRPHSLALVGILVGFVLGLTGCAHDRHTGAVIGAAVGATIGYVISNEADHHDRGHYGKHHDPYHHGHHPRRTHYPPPRTPHCP